MESYRIAKGLLSLWLSMNVNYDIANRAALEAGKEILHIYHNRDDFEVEAKGDLSPLTIADRVAHERIIQHLKKTGIPVLSEEGKDMVYFSRADWDLFWLVDPLDGTKEFIKKNGEFTVNIALVKNQEPIFGVVYAPVLHELYVGIPGIGSFLCCNEKDMYQPTDYLIQLSRQLPLENGNRKYTVVASRSHLNPETEDYLTSVRQAHPDLELISRGSSLKLCMVAKGDADEYPRLGPTMEWDVAAAHAVVKGAGMEVRQWKTGLPLEYNKQELLNPYFIVKK